MITYNIKSQEEKEIFTKTVSNAIEKEQEKTQCPLCKVGTIEIVTSQKIRNYMLAACNHCKAGAF